MRTRLAFKLRFALIAIFILAIPRLGSADANTTVSITKPAPLEAISSTGELTGVNEATVGTHYAFVRADGAKIILKDANGNLYRIMLSATDYTPPAAAPLVPTNPATQPTSLRATAAAGVPVAKPMQMQFEAPDAVQEDLVGQVKNDDEKTYKVTDGGQRWEYDSEDFKAYNEQGYQLEESSWNETGYLKSKQLTTYDPNGTVLGRQGMDASGVFISTSTLTLDPAGRKMTTEVKAPDGTFQERRVTIYDNWGKERDITFFDAQNNVLKKSTMQRNSRGKEVSVIFADANGQPQTTFSLEWNADGSQSASTMTEVAKDFVTQTTYDYPDHDWHGNWTTRNEKAVFQRNGQTLFEVDTTTERVLTYY